MKVSPAAVVCSLALLPAALGAADLRPARAALDRADRQTAVALARKVLADEPGNAEAWIVLGHGLSGQIDGASIFAKADLARQGLAAYTKATELAPANVEAHVALVEFYRQAPAIVGGSMEKARAEADRLLQLDAAVGEFWRMRLALIERRDADALRAAGRVLELAPHEYQDFYWAAKVSVVTGRELARGVEAIRRALRCKPDDDDPGYDQANLALGRLLEMQGDRAGARQAYAAALAINPKLEEARARLAGGS